MSLTFDLDSDGTITQNQQKEGMNSERKSDIKTNTDRTRSTYSVIF